MIYFFIKDAWSIDIDFRMQSAWKISNTRCLFIIKYSNIPPLPFHIPIPLFLNFPLWSALSPSLTSQSPTHITHPSSIFNSSSHSRPPHNFLLHQSNPFPFCCPSFPIYLHVNHPSPTPTPPPDTPPSPTVTLLPVPLHISPFYRLHPPSPHPNNHPHRHSPPIYQSPPPSSPFSLYYIYFSFSRLYLF